jgi:hypothetical protein
MFTIINSDNKMYSIINLDNNKILIDKNFLLNKSEFYPTEKSNIHKIRYNLRNSENVNIKLLSGKQNYSTQLYNEDLIITLYLNNDNTFIKTLKRIENMLINKIVPNKEKKNIVNKLLEQYKIPDVISDLIFEYGIYKLNNFKKLNYFNFIKSGSKPINIKYKDKQRNKIFIKSTKDDLIYGDSITCPGLIGKEMLSGVLGNYNGCFTADEKKINLLLDFNIIFIPKFNKYISKLEIDGMEIYKNQDK